MRPTCNQSVRLKIRLYHLARFGVWACPSLIPFILPQSDPAGRLGMTKFMKQPRTMVLFAWILLGLGVAFGFYSGDRIEHFLGFMFAGVAAFNSTLGMIYYRFKLVNADFSDYQSGIKINVVFSVMFSVCNILYLLYHISRFFF